MYTEEASSIMRRLSRIFFDLMKVGTGDDKDYRGHQAWDQPASVDILLFVTFSLGETSL